MSDERHFLDSDGDGHWYVVPLARRDEWEAANNASGEVAEELFEAFSGCRVGGAPTLVTFTDPEID